MANPLRVSIAARATLASGLFALTGHPVLAADAAAKERRSGRGHRHRAVRQQNMQETPLAVTAIFRRTARSAQPEQHYRHHRPGSRRYSQAAEPGFGPSISAYIRGIGAYDFNPALEPGVGLYVDDVYIRTLHPVP